MVFEGLMVEDDDDKFSVVVLGFTDLMGMLCMCGESVSI